jgi:sugar phosphate isomerase/epimerase
MVNVGRLRGRFVDGVPNEQTLDWMAEAVVACATYRPEVAIVMEPVNHQYANCLLNTRDTLDFVRRINLPNVGIMLDSVHMSVEGEDADASMHAALPWFWHFHISDSDRLPVGAGTLDIASFFAALDRVGFHRTVTVETFQIPDARTAIAASYRAVARYFA